jgi:hypothetical protein
MTEKPHEPFDPADTSHPLCTTRLRIQLIPSMRATRRRRNKSPIDPTKVPTKSAQGIRRSNTHGRKAVRRLIRRDGPRKFLP